MYLSPSCLVYRTRLLFIIRHPVCLKNTPPVYLPPSFLYIYYTSCLCICHHLVSSIGHASCLSTANLIVYRTLLLFVCKSRASNQYRQDTAVTPGISSFLFYVIVLSTSHSFRRRNSSLFGDLWRFFWELIGALGLRAILDNVYFQHCKIASNIAQVLQSFQYYYGVF